MPIASGVQGVWISILYGVHVLEKRPIADGTLLLVPTTLPKLVCAIWQLL